MGIKITSDNIDFKEYLNAIELAIKKNFGTISNTSLEYIALNHLLRSNDHMRSILALLSCEAISGNYHPAIPVAVGYEMAHSTALIHDDIIDGAIFKKGSKTVIEEYGLPITLLLTDWLMFSVFGQFSKYCSSNISKRQLHKLLKIAEITGKASIQGEFQDQKLANFKKISLKNYLKMIKLKTGSLIAAATASGGIVSGAKLDQINALFKFGEYLGMSYQVLDDLLDVIDSNENKKSTFTDIRNGKLNAVLVHALINTNRKNANFINSLISKEITIIEREQLKKIFEKTGSIRFANELSLDLSEKSRACLMILKNSADITKLLAFSYIAVNQ
jgi:geranylgeranyl pyrophosphate synthase